MNTVAELIEKLKQFPADMPVRISQRENTRRWEYWKINKVDESHLQNQSTDGDPEEYWNDPKDYELEPELKPTENHPHFKYQGKLILIS